MEAAPQQSEQLQIVLAVCWGNIARSPAFAIMMNRMFVSLGYENQLVAVSRGIQGTAIAPEPVKFPNITYYRQMYEDSRETLAKLGVDLSAHVSRPVDEEIVDRASLILAADNRVQNGLVRLFPKHTQKVRLFSSLVGEEFEVTDPDGVTGQKRQERIFKLLKTMVHEGWITLAGLVDPDLPILYEYLDKTYQEPAQVPQPFYDQLLNKLHGIIAGNGPNVLPDL